MDVMSTPTPQLSNNTTDGALFTSMEDFVTYVAPIFYVQGIIGNLFVLVIFLLSSNIRQRGVVDFLIPLSIADLIFLVFGALMNWMQLDISNAIHHSLNVLSTAASCKIISYIGWVGICVSNWVVVLLTWERALILSKLCTLSWMTRRFRLTALGVMVACSVLLLIPVLVKYEIDDDGILIECDYFPNSNKLLSYLGPTLMSVYVFTIPVIGVWIANTIIIVCLIRKRKPQDTDEDPDEAKRRSDERKLVIQLIAIPILFLVCTTPTVIFNTWMNVTDYKIDVLGEKSLENLYTEIVGGLMDFLSRFIYLNNCVNWVVYVVALRWFRNEVKVVCCPSLLPVDQEELEQPLVFDVSADVEI